MAAFGSFALLIALALAAYNFLAGAVALLSIEPDKSVHTRPPRPSFKLSWHLVWIPIVLYISVVLYFVALDGTSLSNATGGSLTVFAERLVGAALALPALLIVFRVL